jgi:hypothetical protein
VDQNGTVYCEQVKTKRNSYCEQSMSTLCLFHTILEPVYCESSRDILCSFHYLGNHSGGELESNSCALVIETVTVSPLKLPVFVRKFSELINENRHSLLADKSRLARLKWTLLTARSVTTSTPRITSQRTKSSFSLRVRRPRSSFPSTDSNFQHWRSVC